MKASLKSVANLNWRHCSMTPYPAFQLLLRLNVHNSLLKVAAFLPFILPWPFCIGSPFEWNMKIIAKSLTCTSLLTLIIVFHSGTACVGERWGEMWHGVAPPVGDFVSILPFEQMCGWIKLVLWLWWWWSYPIYCVCVSVAILRNVTVISALL